MADAREPARQPAGDDDMRRSYVRVLVAWLVTLAALYVLQQYFSIR